jgi:NAD(P)H dehydrogenase (quinone)
MRIAVTGASGNVGGHVVRLLAEQGGAEVVAITRRPAALPSTVTARTADYGDPGALRSSLADVDTLVFVSSDGEATRVLAHHLNVVSAARECGVGHIVLLSGVDADTDSPFCYAVTNGFTEQAIRDSGCGYSFVRASIFTEFFRHFLTPARSTGQIRLPAGDGRVGLVSRADVARCLGALARSAPSGRCHEVTGSRALDLAAAASTAAQAWDRPVVYQPIEAAEHIKQLAMTENPWWLYAYTSMFASVREHRWERVTDEVQHLTGRAPLDLADVLKAQTAS